jgi:antitoxin (DNA-binding transcriptional repressor) of toxin-antitoxin stability system
MLYFQVDTVITGETSASPGEFVRGIFGRLAPVLPQLIREWGRIKMEAMIEVDDEEIGLGECIDQMEKTGEALTILRGNRPVARLIPHKERDPLVMDPVLKGAFYVSDPVSPLPDSDWPEELRWGHEPHHL